MRAWLLLVALVTLGGVSACSRPSRSQSSAHAAIAPPASNLDKVFTSPLHAYTIRYNHTWTVRQVPSQAGLLDFFTLPNATMSVSSDHVLPGTDLDKLVQSTLEGYQRVNLQGLERAGAVDIGGAKGQLLHVVTYVTATGETVAQPPTADAKPRNLYQAFYLAGDRSFTFSIAWPQSDLSDYLGLFRSVLRTFTLAGTT